MQTIPCIAVHRQEFLRLAEDIHRELAIPIPPMHLESGESIALSLNVGGAAFEITHSLTHNPSSVLVDCEVSPIPKGAVDQFEPRLLRASAELFRTRRASLGANAVQQALFCSQWRLLASSTATGLLSEAQMLVEPVRCWARAGLHEELVIAVVEACTSPAATSDGAAYWRRMFLATVDAMNAKRAPGEGYDGDAVSVVAVEVMHDETRFFMMHSLAVPHSLTLELQLSPEASVHSLGAMERLLQVNWELSRGECAAFSVAQQGDLVIFACALDLEGLSPEMLRKRMSEFCVGEPNDSHD